MSDSTTPDRPAPPRPGRIDRVLVPYAPGLARVGAGGETRGGAAVGIIRLLRIDGRLAFVEGMVGGLKATWHVGTGRVFADGRDDPGDLVAVDPPLPRSARITSTLARLRAAWPAVFTAGDRPRRPLKIGIRGDILAARPDLVPHLVYKALARYTRHRAYRAALVPGAPRIGLDGEPDGVVTTRDAGAPIDRLVMANFTSTTLAGASPDMLDAVETIGLVALCDEILGADPRHQPTVRETVADPRLARALMAADLAELLAAAGADGTVAGEDLIRRGWTADQVRRHGTAARAIAVEMTAAVDTALAEEAA